MLRLRAFRLVKRDEENASLEGEEGTSLAPITEFAAKTPADDDDEALSEIVQAFNDRHGTDFQPEDMRKFEEDGDAVADEEEMSEMLRINPRDVVFPECNRKVFNQLVRRLHRENKLSNIIMTDPVVRGRLTKHLFDRAMKRATAPATYKVMQGLEGTRRNGDPIPGEHDEASG